MKVSLRAEADISLNAEPQIDPVTDEDVDAAIRIDQSVTIVRLAPLMMISNVFVPLILCLSILPRLSAWFVVGWLSLLAVLNVPILLSWIRLRLRPPPRRVSTRRMSRIALWSTALGISPLDRSSFIKKAGTPVKS